MFTGIINGRGLVVAAEKTRGEARLTIQARFDLPDLVIGESIAVNGTCLSVENGAAGRFTAYASGETLARTTLSALKHGSRVNLERALALGDRLGGHIVSGHVDCVATVEQISRAGESRRIRLAFPPAFGPEVIRKGSVALDGISLTVNDCGPNFLEVNVIPETWKETTIADWTPGTSVNLETDVLGKYVRHMLAPHVEHLAGGTAAASSTARGSTPERPRQHGLSLEFLRENGFF